MGTLKRQFFYVENATFVQRRTLNVETGLELLHLKFNCKFILMKKNPKKFNIDSALDYYWYFNVDSKLFFVCTSLCHLANVEKNSEFNIINCCIMLTERFLKRLVYRFFFLFYESLKSTSMYFWVSHILHTIFHIYDTLPSVTQVKVLEPNLLSTLILIRSRNINIRILKAIRFSIFNPISTLFKCWKCTLHQCSAGCISQNKITV